MNFKLFLDEVAGVDEEGEPIHRFGGEEADHEAAMKAAHSALQARSALYHCRVPGFCYPMVALINFRGYSVLASAQLPINDSTMIYGTNGSETKHDPAIHNSLKLVAKRLNLSERIGAGGRRYVGPLELQVHKGFDGRNYVLNYDFLMPREAPRYPFPSFYELFFSKPLRLATRSRTLARTLVYGRASSPNPPIPS